MPGKITNSAPMQAFMHLFDKGHRRIILRLWESNKEIDTIFRNNLLNIRTATYDFFCISMSVCET